MGSHAEESTDLQDGSGVSHRAGVTRRVPAGSCALALALLTSCSGGGTPLQVGGPARMTTTPNVVGWEFPSADSGAAAMVEAINRHDWGAYFDTMCAAYVRTQGLTRSEFIALENRVQKPSPAAGDEVVLGVAVPPDDVDPASVSTAGDVERDPASVAWFDIGTRTQTWGVWRFVWEGDTWKVCGAGERKRPGDGRQVAARR